MKARGAPFVGAVLCLALVRAGPSHALSLRSSAAEAFLGDVSPGTAVVFSKAAGERLRVENSGAEEVRVEFRAVAPPPGGLKEGCEPWPDPGRVRVTPQGAELKPGQAAEVELAMTAPQGSGAAGAQYQFDVLATGVTRAGASLTLRTRVLASVGPPLAHVRDVPDAGADMPGFELAPTHAALDGVSGTDPGDEATVKMINAGEEDMTVTLTPARDWDKQVRIPEGYAPAPNPRWLRLEPGVVKVRAGAIGRARVGASIPREPRYAGRKWAFVVAADAVAGGRRTRRWFVLSVRTRDLEEDTRAR